MAKKAGKPAKAAKKSAGKAVKKTASKSAKKSAKKPVKPAKKASSKPAKKSVKKSVKKAASKPVKKAAAKASSKSAAGKAAKSKSTKKATMTKSASKSAGKSSSKSAKKSAEKSAAAKPAVGRTAVKSSKGVLIRVKRSASAPAPAAEERVKLRHVNATEKSKGSNPVTLHHRKPTKQEAIELRQMLVTRRNQLAGDVQGLEAEAFSDETQHVSSNHLADSSFEQYEQEFNLSMIENETEELKEIARAIEKVDEGSYGVCESCGIDISIERLRAMPYTRICIHCRTKYEEEGGGEVYGVHPERRV